MTERQNTTGNIPMENKPKNKCWVDFEDIKKEWMKNESFVAEYNRLELEWKISLELVKARTGAGLTQEEIAKRLGTTQSVIARLESGRSLPSLKTLHRYAQAAGKTINLHFL